MSGLDFFTTATAAWFNAVFDEPTPAQNRGWHSIVARDHTLIHAPTGSGKTLAAFLSALDRLSTGSPPPNRKRCRILYVSPLKALAYDIERNLRAPLVAGFPLQHRRTPPDVGISLRAFAQGHRPQRNVRSQRSTHFLTATESSHATSFLPKGSPEGSPVCIASCPVSKMWARFVVATS
ncbi:MAG: DEAD/DEAH box helicase, partial [Acidimicrobiia bacterium]